MALFATLSFNYASTTIFLVSPRLVHLHPNPAGSPLVIIFPRVAWSLVGFPSARKTAVISRFCDGRKRLRASRIAPRSVEIVRRILRITNRSFGHAIQFLSKGTYVASISHTREFFSNLYKVICIPKV